MSRLTLKEAISHAKEVAEENYRRGMLCHANPNDEELDKCIECGREHEQLAGWLEELRRYKDLKEQGRLIELPCKIGDTLWTIDPNINFIDDFKVTDIDIVKEGIAICNHYLGYSCDVNDFGKTVFLTKEEAEEQLKERGERE